MSRHLDIPPIKEALESRFVPVSDGTSDCKDTGRENHDRREVLTGVLIFDPFTTLSGVYATVGAFLGVIGL
jgi:hypothetical protein